MGLQWLKQVKRRLFGERCLQPTRNHRNQTPLVLEHLEDRITPAAVMDSGTELIFDLAANESVTVVSDSTSYSFVSNQLFSDSGVIDASHFGGFGGSSLTLNSSGLAHYSTISIIDSGAGASFRFGNSGLAVYHDSFHIALDSGSTTTTIGSSVSVLGGDLTIESDDVTINANTSAANGQHYAGVVNIDTAVLLSVSGSADITFDSQLTGDSRLWLSTSGDVVFNDTVDIGARLNIDANTVFVNGGTFDVDGNLVVTGDVIVNGNSVLGNRGTISGSVTINSPATLRPEFGPGILNTGSFSLDLGTTLEMTIDGIDAGTKRDQINVTGTVSLGAATLSLVGPNFQPDSRELVLIDNDGNDAVLGTFSGLAEGATVTIGDEDFRLSYVGGTGNDVTITPLETRDFGDAPDTGAGTGAGELQHG